MGLKNQIKQKNKKIKNMNKSFRVHNDSAILNRALAFLLFGLKQVFCVSFEYPLVVKNNITPSIVKVTRLYMIDAVMKIILATERRQASPCSVLSTNK